MDLINYLLECLRSLLTPNTVNSGGFNANVPASKPAQPLNLTVPRGIRNNNPTNIIHSGIKWQGLADVPSDGYYAKFIAAHWGIRAAARNLQTYFNRGDNTLAKIINKWAPSIENNTESYIRHAEQALNVNRDEVLEQSRIIDLIKLIIQHENGQQPYSHETIENAIKDS